MIMKHERNSTEKMDFLQKTFDVTAIIRETKSTPSNLTNISAVQNVRNSHLELIKSPWRFADVVANTTPQPEIIYR